MAEPGHAFHAHPPAGHWLNDPNGLVHADGAYRLFAQHRADAPAFRETGWARFSSPDLLRWTFDGSVIPPAKPDWAYSGCVLQTEQGLEALHTAHADRLERQVRRTSTDGGRSWSSPEDLPSLGHPTPNRRDPFVFRDGDAWGLLLAEPCDWTDWEQKPPSRLRRYHSLDRRSWAEVGTIGPWRPPGIMWEVPLLLRIDSHDVLIVSEVDRRDGVADCAVRAWIGRLTPAGFEPLDRVGQPVDFGPDFYALMAGSGPDWPLSHLTCVAWLSSWNTARTTAWPGFHGGTISLPRLLGVEARDGTLHLTNRPLPEVVAAFTRPSSTAPKAGLGRFTAHGDRLTFELRAGDNAALIECDWRAGTLSAARSGTAPWRGTAPLGSATDGDILLFVDGPVVEFFIDGASLSLALDGSDGLFEVAARLDGTPAPISWTVLP